MRRAPRSRSVPGVITVLALHGNGGGGARFARVLPHLPADVALVTPTLPGFAGGQEPGDLTPAGLAAHVRGLLADLPRPRVVLGHGIGGSVALELLRDAAAEVDGVVLHAPVGARLDTRLLPRLMQLPGATEVLRRGISSRLTRPFVRRRLFTPGLVPRATADAFLAAYGQCRAFGPLFRTIDAPWFASLEPREVPAVLLWGEGDGVLGADQAGDYRALLPRARVELVPGWTHWPMLEQPEDYAAVVARLARELAR